MLPYFLGCPSWNEPAWRGSLYPAGMASRDFLPAYCRVFNTVEGNTTFYARPAAATLARWAQAMPDDFHFCAKLPRDVSHEGDLRDNLGAARDFLALLAPLGARVTPEHLAVRPQPDYTFGHHRVRQVPLPARKAG